MPMSIRDLLASVAQSWDRTADFSAPAQLLLKAASEYIQPVIPAGYLAEGSGGKGVATRTPWIAIFDPDETTTAQKGMYVVYLFAEDMSTVSLSLNHGVTELVRRYAGQGRSRTEARERLALEASAIRTALSQEATNGLNTHLDLKSSGPLQIDYQHGHALGIEYDCAHLPATSVLEHDLDRILALYADALAVRERLRQAVPGAIVTTRSVASTLPEDPLLQFKPKDDTDYRNYIAGRELIKTRRHETLLKQFGTWAQRRGFVVGTNVHPRDMLLIKGTHRWLVEAKVVYRGNSTHAVRDAIGQLFTYQHMFYADQPAPHLLAVFTEEIGTAYAQLLDSLNIASVWKSAGGDWTGSRLADLYQLV